MSASRIPTRRAAVAAMVTAVVATLAVATPGAHAAAAPIPGAWTGSLNWAEDFTDATGSEQGNYCSQVVTVPYSVDLSESVSLSPFSFTLANSPAPDPYVSEPTAATGSLSFTVTYNLPRTSNGGTICPADVQTESGSFSGSGMTTVTGAVETAQNSGPYLSIADWAAGEGGQAGGGWPGELTLTDQDVNNGKPDVSDDLLWLPHISVDVAIGSNDSGSWGGQLPGTNFFQKHDDTSDAIVDSTGGVSYTIPRAGLFGSANARVTGPSTAKPPVPKVPVTTITKAPKAKTSATAATFHFTSNEKGSTFRCSLGKGTPKPCTSPKTYTHLAKGKHTMYVYAVNQSGKKDLTPAHWSWTVVKKKNLETA